MSQLRSVITEATGFDPRGLTPEELAAEITEAVHCRQLLETAVAGWVKIWLTGVVIVIWAIRRRLRF